MRKLIVAYALPENADLKLLSLLWLTLMEWNLAPPRRANTIIMTEANGRTGLDNAQAANHDKEAGWNVVGSFSEDTPANGRETVNICVQAGLFMGNTWSNGEPTAFTPMSPSGHRLDYTTTLHLGRNALTRVKSKLAMNLVRVFNSPRSMTTFMSDSHLRILHARDGTMLRCVGQ